MTSAHNTLRRLAVGTSGLAAVLSGLVVTAGTAQATPSVCAGYAHCRVVATKDVDGDRQADQVGWIRRSTRIVVIRVITADGEHLARRVNVRHWPGGGAWAGAAYVDGRPGAELLVGTSLGAHTPWYTMLTYRRGGLVAERSPLHDTEWFVDSAATVAAGWWRHDVDGRVMLRNRYATLDEGTRFHGRNVSYTWRHGRWVKVRSVRTTYPQSRVHDIEGWHVRGLDEFPGL